MAKKASAKKAKKGFTEKARERILAYADRHSAAKAAAKFGCSKSTIYRWRAQ